MNLTPGTIQSWEELCARFTANFASAYQQHGVEAHLHAVRQKPGEMLRAFISRFTKVRGTIPHISDASIITAFRQGVRDEKMLEKLETHEVESVTTLFSLADKCARAAEGRAWHSAPQDGDTKAGGSGATAQGGSKKKKNKNRSRGEPHPGGPVIVAAVPAAAPAAVAAAGGQNAHGKRPRPQDGSGGSCSVHPTARHSAADCREIQKLAKRVSGRHEQSSKDGSPPPRQRPGKEKAFDSGAAVGEKELGYQSPARELKGVYQGDNSDSDDGDRRKKLYVKYGGSWELVSRSDVKTLRREVLSVKPGVPKAAPHQRWMNTTISFGPSDCQRIWLGPVYYL